MLVENKLNMSEQRVLAAKGASDTLGSTESVARRTRQVILPFHSAPVGQSGVLGPLLLSDFTKTTPVKPLEENNPGFVDLCLFYTSDLTISDSCREPPIFAEFWVPHYKKDMDVQERVQRRAVELVKGLERESYEELPRELRVFRLEKRIFIGGSSQVTAFQGVAVRSLSTSSPHEHPEHGRLVYKGNLAKTVLGVRFFSYSTSIFNLFMMPYIMLKSGIGVESLLVQAAFYGLIGFFTFVTPVTLHVLTKGYVIRLYYKDEMDTYTAITYNAILAEKATVFHREDVKIPDITKMFTTFYAKTKSMLVNPTLFPNPQDYNHLMGYDKSSLFKLEELKEAEERK
ncbi:transmembrane protein 70 [Willisornis vidua]|uniref:Transmembrane protein 70 n=1 Tax=Willisornis vidua TaxID=1566151 RepID=A0ABQ9CR10_9PASS|nr:transmembrane protein 70 [Willisornis vidua]